MLDPALGSYYPSGSPLHRLDARTKLGIEVLYLVLVVGSPLPGQEALLGALLVAGYLRAALPLRIWAAMGKILLILALLTAPLEMLLHPGPALWHLGPLTITRVGLLRAQRVTVETTLVLAASGLLLYTTPPSALSQGLLWFLTPLRRLRFPVQDLSLMLGISVRFLPLLFEEGNRIRQAQKARGIPVDQGLLWRPETLLPLLIPLLEGTFQRAEEIALALAARGYRADMVPAPAFTPSFSRRDLGALLLVLLAFGMVKTIG